MFKYFMFENNKKFKFVILKSDTYIKDINKK